MMGFSVDVEAVVNRLPADVVVDSVERLELVISDSINVIEWAFEDAGRSFTRELEVKPSLAARAEAVVVEMVGSLMIAGARKGIRSVSSTTGPTSDSTTYADADYSGWTRAFLTPEMAALLGLSSGLPRGRFPSRLRWPERRAYGFRR